MRSFKLIIVLIAITAFVAACGNSVSENKPLEKANANVSADPKPSASVDELASSKAIYKEHCAKCHKDDGTGGAVEIDGEKLKAEDFTSDKMKKMDDEKYIKYTTKGILDEGMPAFEKILTEAEIKDVVKFIRTEFQK